MTKGIPAMTVLAASPFPAETLLDDLSPESGLAPRRWTPDEFRRLASSAVLGAAALALADGEIVDAASRAIYLFDRDEYYNLAEQGILGPEERTELIYGRIITHMSPMSRPHSLSIAITADALEAAFGNTAAVEDQLAIHLESGLEPQPDVVVLRGSSRDYPEIPRPADVLLLVEVSYSTLHYDRNTKSGMYAENGIPEYWIINLRRRKLEVYRQPDAGEYLDLQWYSDTEAVAPLAAPNALVRVADLLPMVQK